MIRKTMIRFAVVSALGSLLMVPMAFAGPEMTFGPENQGTLKFEYKGQFQAIARDAGSGVDGLDHTYNFNVRRNRLALMGAYGPIMSVYVQTEFTQDANLGPLSLASQNTGTNFQMLDAVVRFDLHDAFKVNVGKFKYNFTRENLEACENPLTLDRSLFVRAPFVATRDVGVAVWGNLLQEKLQYRADVMEGRPATTYATSPKSNARYSVRGHVSLLDPENQYGYKGTYLGEKKVMTFGASYQIEPNVIFQDVALQGTPADYKGWSADAFIEYPVQGLGTFTFGSAYEKVDFGDAYQAIHPDLDAIGLTGERNGYYVKGGYMLPKLPLQVFGRYEAWRYGMLNNVYNQRVDWYGGGANYYVWGQNLKVSVEMSSTNFDRTGTFSGIQGDNLSTRDFNTFTGQLQVLF